MTTSKLLDLLIWVDDLYFYYDKFFNSWEEIEEHEIDEMVEILESINDNVSKREYKRLLGKIFSY